jgi:hypothetical protein
MCFSLKKEKDASDIYGTGVRGVNARKRPPTVGGLEKIPEPAGLRQEPGEGRMRFDRPVRRKRVSG